MSKIGPKELALRDMRTDIPIALLRGHPDCKFKSGPAPKITKTKRNDGVTLAPPLSVQKAIAADLAETEAETQPATAMPAAEPKEIDMAKAHGSTKPRTITKTTAKISTRRSVKSKTARKTIPRYDWDAALEKAKNGTLPTAPDFSASTHDGYRKRFDAVVAMAKSGDLAGLKKDNTKPISGSRKIICRYRDTVISALVAKSK